MKDNTATHRLLSEQDKSLTLCNGDGKRLKCPFQQPVMDVNTVSHQMVLRHKNCGNWCPFFNVNVDDNNDLTVELRCTANGACLSVVPVAAADQQNGKIEIVR